MKTVRRESSSRTSLKLLAGATGSGLAAVVAMWLGSSHLGLDGFAPVAQLWTIWGVVATGMVFGFQQWEITRNRHLDGAVAMPIPRRIVGTVVVASIVLGGVSALATSEIFDSDSWGWSAATATLPIGTAASGLSYASLARRARFGSLALIGVAENSLRLTVTGLLVAADAGATWFAITVPIGFVIAAVPGLLQQRSGSASSSAGFGTGHVWSMSVVGFATHMVIFGAPLLLGLGGGTPAEVSALFLVLIPLRVPFVLVQGLLPALATETNTWVHRGDAPRLLRPVRRLVAGAFAVGGVLAAIGWVIGDSLADQFFEVGAALEPAVYATFGATTTVGLALLATNVIVIALARVRQLLAIWGSVIGAQLLLVAVGALSGPTEVGIWVILLNAAALAMSASIARAGLRRLSEPLR